MKLITICLLSLTAFSASVFADTTDNQPFVLPEHVSKWEGKPYEGPIEVSIWREENVIRALIETQDLIMTSLTIDKLDAYVALFGDPAAVEKYMDAMTWTSKEVGMAVSRWVQRWEEFQDPFSAFAVYSKNEGAHFIGHLVLGHGRRYGQSELAFLFAPQHRDIEHAVQAVTAVVQGYVPHIAGKHLVNLNGSVTASPLHSVHSTARFDDTFSGQALVRSGFKIGVEEVLWDAPRFNYLITLDQIHQNNDSSQDLLIDGED